ncbi:MAG: heat-inducible transcriptional repressor HrcA [Phormidium sp.]
MTGQFALTDRQQQILWATVRHYIATAEPVGSKSLVDDYNLSVSSATIRSGMGLLEKAGMLYQPHTSAGRVPSDFGYRVYVDYLMTPSDTLADRAQRLFAERLNWETWSLEAVLRGAAQILSTLSGYITLISLPQLHTASLRHLQLLQVDPGQVMLIVVTDAYQTQSMLMSGPSSGEGTEEDLDPEILERELQILSNFLNSQLRGKTIADLAALDWGELDRQFQRYADSLKTLFVDLAQRLEPPTISPMAISGLAEVLRQPEFTELQQIQSLVQLLEEEQEQLFPLMFEPSELSRSDRRVNVRIGSENPLEPIRSCTLVSATYRRGSQAVGSLSLLGPTRMTYDGAITMVQAAADYLSNQLSTLDS